MPPRLLCNDNHVNRIILRLTVFRSYSIFVQLIKAQLRLNTLPALTLFYWKSLKLLTIDLTNISVIHHAKF